MALVLNLVLNRGRARLLLVGLALGLAGCASYAERYAQANEEGLRAAGFTVRPADTPEKLASLQGMTQRRILVYTRLGQPYYVWPDARFCRCFSRIGSEDQGHQEYARLGFEQRLARERQTAAEENEAAYSSRGPGGPGELPRTPPRTPPRTLMTDDERRKA